MIEEDKELIANWLLHSGHVDKNFPIGNIMTTTSSSDQENDVSNPKSDSSLDSSTESENTEIPGNK